MRKVLSDHRLASFLFFQDGSFGNLFRFPHASQCLPFSQYSARFRRCFRCPSRDHFLSIRNLCPRKCLIAFVFRNRPSVLVF
jgi:hypothetical protein